MSNIAILLGIFATLVFAYALVSKKAESANITAQMIFVAAGLVLGAEGLELMELGPVTEFILIVAEIALVFTLFVDASRINPAALRGRASLPGRMLSIGLPLTIAFGMATAVLLLIDLSLWEAALLAAILAPTDAALGQAVINNTAIPQRIRQALNVESGLNDGISVPFFLLFLALAAGAVFEQPLGALAVIVLQQIGIGATVGFIVGAAGGWLTARSARRGWISSPFRWMSLVALALVAWALAEILGGSYFVAAFVGGLTATTVERGIGEQVVEFTETEGEILNLAVFFLFSFFGAHLLIGLDWRGALYAVLSLTLIRMIPIAISLIGTNLTGSTVLFMGWFGPRGLASVVLLLIAVIEEGEIPGLGLVGQVAATTVLLSVFAHGISANPLGKWYARHAERLVPEASEKEEVVPIPTRRKEQQSPRHGQNQEKKARPP